MGVVDFSEIRRRREAKKFTLAEASKRARWSSGQVWANLEQGTRDNPSIETLVKVAEVLGCRVDQLLRKK